MTIKRSMSEVWDELTPPKQTYLKLHAHDPLPVDIVVTLARLGVSSAAAYWVASPRPLEFRLGDDDAEWIEQHAE